MSALLTFIVRNAYWLLFLVLETVSAVLLFGYNSYHASVWVSSANVVAGKTFAWMSRADQFFAMRANNEQLTLRNFHLERQVSELRQLYFDSTADSSFIDSLSHAQVSRYKVIAAKVVSNEVVRRDNLLTINRGSADGVRKDMGVASGNGIVGVVYLVGTHYSVVIPVINSHSSISCSIRGTGYFGYLAWQGGDPTVAYVDGVPRHAKVHRGQWVETSGYSAIFPRGIVVGRVEGVYNSADGLSYRLKVRLTTDFGRLRDVCVIDAPDLQEQLQLQEAARDSLIHNS